MKFFPLKFLRYQSLSGYTVKKFTVFPVLAGMSPTKLSLAGNNLIIPGQGGFG
jgi:hypothetical protein